MINDTKKIGLKPDTNHLTPSTPVKTTLGSWFNKGLKVVAWSTAKGTTLVVSGALAFQTRAIINTWAPKLILDYAMKSSETAVEEYLKQHASSLAGGMLSSYSATIIGGAFVGPAITEMARPFVEYAAYSAAAVVGVTTATIMNSGFNAIANKFGEVKQELVAEEVKPEQEAEEVKEDQIPEDVKADLESSVEQEALEDKVAPAANVIPAPAPEIDAINASDEDNDFWQTIAEIPL